MSRRVLFVCLGNICRSPLAEGVLLKRAEQSGVLLTVDSAGTANWHAGNPPDARAIVAARSNGFEISHQRARPLSRMDFADFDLIVAMDRDVLADVEAVRPVDGQGAEVRMLTSFRASAGPEDVPDPYYSGRFDPVIAQMEECMDGLLDYATGAQ